MITPENVFSFAFNNFIQNSRDLELSPVANCRVQLADGQTAHEPEYVLDAID